MTRGNRAGYSFGRTDRPAAPQPSTWPGGPKPSRSHSPCDDCGPCHTVLAATNKCLAQNNKSRTGGEATNKQFYRGSTGRALRLRPQLIIINLCVSNERV